MNTTADGLTKYAGLSTDTGLASLWNTPTTAPRTTAARLNSSPFIGSWMPFYKLCCYPIAAITGLMTFSQFRAKMSACADQMNFHHCDANCHILAPLWQRPVYLDNSTSARRWRFNCCGHIHFSRRTSASLKTSAHVHTRHAVFLTGTGLASL